MTVEQRETAGRRRLYSAETGACIALRRALASVVGSGLLTLLALLVLGLEVVL